METLSITGTDLKPSRIALGTWAIGGRMWGGTDENASIRTIHAALDKGINLIDTAPAYGLGRSEEIVGKALKRHSHPDQALLATKVGLEWDDKGNIKRNATRARIMKEIDDSLRRLGVDHIDIYQVHWPDPLVDPQETADAMAHLYKAGKIRAIGVSNFTPEQMEAFRQAAPLHVSQSPLNLLERGIEEDVLPWTREHGIALLSYGSLCRGLLSGRMGEDTAFEGDDLRKNDPKFQKGRYGQYLSAVEALKKLSSKRFCKTVLELAIRWSLDQAPNSVALWGARRPDQVEAVPGVMGWSIDADARIEIDQILEHHVTNPIGPEFMAPPARAD